jgi:arsenate reductase (thioredoxin)
MAQGLLNWLAPDRYTALSAGTHPSQIHPFTIRVMDELGIDIRSQGTHHVQDYLGQPFDTVITVCDSAAEECPTFAGARKQLHWGFADPSSVTGDAAAQLVAFRHTRDLILVQLRQWIGQPADETPPPLHLHDDHAATRLLLLCPGDSARAQIGEAWVSRMGGAHYAVVSAGPHPTPVHPLVIAVMDERGVNMRGTQTASLNDIVHQPFDEVITLYDPATEQCPVFPGSANQEQWNFPDPATIGGSRMEQVKAFRAVRDGLYFAFWSWIAHRQEEH